MENAGEIAGEMREIIREKMREKMRKKCGRNAGENAGSLMPARFRISLYPNLEKKPSTSVMLDHSSAHIPGVSRAPIGVANGYKTMIMLQCWCGAWFILEKWSASVFSKFSNLKKVENRTKAELGLRCGNAQIPHETCGFLEPHTARFQIGTARFREF